MTNQSKLLIYPLDRSAFIQLRKPGLACESKKGTPLQAYPSCYQLRYMDAC